MRKKTWELLTSDEPQGKGRRVARIAREVRLMWALFTEPYIYRALGQDLFGTKASRSSHLPRSRRSPTSLLSFLRTFKWFCGRENREHVELSIAHLKIDVRRMRAEHQPEYVVLSVVFWRSLGTVVPIMWDGLLRILGRALPVAKIIRRFKTLL